MATVRNTRTGIITNVPEHYVGHPVLGNDLVLYTGEAEAAPNKETKKKEQPAPAVEAIKPELAINIKEDKE
jgi:hypothetical protein